MKRIRITSRRWTQALETNLGMVEAPAEDHLHRDRAEHRGPGKEKAAAERGKEGLGVYSFRLTLHLPRRFIACAVSSTQENRWLEMTPRKLRR